MALRNQPYLPLYVQDYLTDEKLNMCSWATQGIYIKILCVLHKQKEYGCILFKQNSGTCLDFAAILIRHLPCQLEEMNFALNELIEHEVLHIEGNKLSQKRMVRDNKTSEARSKAAKKGGGNPILFKQKDKQNTENENEYEYENDIVNNNNSVEKISEIIYSDFENFRKQYPGTKRGYTTEFENFKKKHKDWKQIIPILCDNLDEQIRAREMKLRVGAFVPEWKNLSTYINNRSWEEQITINQNEINKRNSRGGATAEDLAEIVGKHFATDYKQ